MSTIGEAFIKIKPESGDFAKEAGSQVSGALKKVAAIASTVVIGKGVVDFFKDSVDLAGATNKSLRVTSQLIKDTGSSAGVSSKQVDDLARSISTSTGINKDSISAAENVVLAHKNIANAAGKGNDVYNQTIKAATDLSTVMGTDTTSAAKLLAKALDDPAKAAAILKRSGVLLTNQQKDQIATYMKSGNLMGAQKVILDQLNKSVGGAAVAASSATGRLKAQYADLKVTMGQAIAPSLGGISTALAQVIPAVEPLFKTLGTLIGSVLTTLGPTIVVVAKSFAEIGDALAPVIPPLGAIIKLLADVFAIGIHLIAEFIGPIIKAMAPLVTAFVKVIEAGLKPIQKAIEPLIPVFAKFVTAIGGTIISAIISFIRAISPIFPILVQVAGKFLEALIPAIEKFTKSAVTLLPALVPIILQLAALLPLILPLATDLATLIGWLTPLAPLLLGIFLAWKSFSFVQMIAGLLQAGAAAVVWAGQMIVSAVTASASWLLATGEMIAASIAAGVAMLLPFLPFIAIGVAVVAIGIIIYKNWASIWDFVKNTFAAGMAWFKKNWDILLAIFTGPIGLIVLIWRRFGDQIKAGFKDVLDWFASIPGKIKNVFLGAVNWLYEAGKHIVSGLLKGLEDGIPGLKGTLGFITKLIPLHKGPPGEDAKLLNPAGRMIMQGLVGGITSQVPSVQTTLKAVTDLIAGTAISPLRAPPITPLVAPLTTAAAAAVKAGVGGSPAPATPTNYLSIEINNPVAETTDASLHHAMQKVAFHGLLPNDWAPV